MYKQIKKTVKELKEKIDKREAIKQIYIWINIHIQN